ncbi:Proteasome subunit beta type-4 [Porphyridium purpureum]|uniref:Proteasome subunit beta n=1 Tax=Porphyridium purpureum TaxID=35688 RepID=A0A5J4YTH8_PORPP|nr:Proteasome subunit beta type-4 [Porphyridium purpureum]|eukprot:POR2582..scf227_4
MKIGGGHVRGGGGAADGPVKVTQTPYVVGSSVLGVKCIDGVVISSDTLASYGSMAKFRKISRIHKVSDACVIGAGGEFSDFQEIKKTMDGVMIEQFCMDDGYVLTPSAIHQYLVRVMYGRRNKMDPLWNQVVMAGFHDGKATLGMVDQVGSNFESEVIATGYGLYMGLPLLRNAYRPDITVAEAKKLLEDIMRVLFYRDARTSNSIQIAAVTKDGVEISEFYDLETKWDYQRFVDGARSGDVSTW